MQKAKKQGFSLEAQPTTTLQSVSSPPIGVTKPHRLFHCSTVFESEYFAVREISMMSGASNLILTIPASEFSIIMVREGRFTFSSRDQTISVLSGGMLLEKNAGCFRHVLEARAHSSCLIVDLTPQGFEAFDFHRPPLLLLLDDDQARSHLQLAMSVGTEFLLTRIFQTKHRSEQPDRPSHEMWSDLLYSVVDQLHLDPKPTPLSWNTQHFHLKTIERAKAHLFEHLDKEITLKELARHCYVSPFHFTRLFKQFSGVPPFHYLQQIRLYAAADLLRFSSVSIAEACFQSGFKRPDYFSTLFAHEFKLSPRKYRKAYQQKRVSCIVHSPAAFESSCVSA